jgi:hypothetical protein
VPSGSAVMLRIPRTATLEELRYKTAQKFLENELLDVHFRGEAAGPPTGGSLSLYYRTPPTSATPNPTTPPSPTTTRARSESVSSTGTGSDHTHSFVKMESNDDWSRALALAPIGGKVVLRLDSVRELDDSEAM